MPSERLQGEYARHNRKLSWTAVGCVISLVVFLVPYMQAREKDASDMAAHIAVQDRRIADLEQRAADDILIANGINKLGERAARIEQAVEDIRARLK